MTGLNNIQVIGFESENEIRAYLSNVLTSNELKFFNKSKYAIFPGFCDVHVHFREPGFVYKETIKSGSMAAAAGGYTTVCTMPNLNPVPDSVENLKIQLDAIAKDAVVKVLPYGAITVGEKGEKLADMEGIVNDVAAFSDDGRGVQSNEIMRQAMVKAKSLGKIIAAHCEDNALLHGGYIHDGKYAKAHNHKGICSESEWKQIERDIKLAEETGAAYHVCHISTKESVELIRQAKRNGINVTCETAPHYLVLDENNLKEDGRFKMNPPLRSTEDRLALIEGIKDGTIDMIATDHAPHSKEEKAKGLAGSAFGIVGLETAFPILYARLVKNGIITLEELIKLMALNPCRRFNIDNGKDFTIFDLEARYKVNPEDFKTEGRATPFEDEEVQGQCMMTIVNGEVVFGRKYR